MLLPGILTTNQWSTSLFVGSALDGASGSRKCTSRDNNNKLQSRMSMLLTGHAQSVISPGFHRPFHLLRLIFNLRWGQFVA